MRAGAQIPEGERPFSYPVWSPGLQGICKHGPGDRVLLSRRFAQGPPKLRLIAVAQEKDLTLSVGLSHVARSPVLQRIRG